MFERDCGEETTRGSSLGCGDLVLYNTRLKSGFPEVTTISVCSVMVHGHMLGFPCIGIIDVLLWNMKCFDLYCIDCMKDLIGF